MKNRRPEEILQHLGFVQRVAADLVHDRELAGDVAQEAITAALASREVPRAGLRGWLVGVVRNTARSQRRNARRRRDHEGRYTEEAERGAGRGPQDVTAEAVARGEERARVASSVMALPEPYRTVVLLRYVEERSPTEIASGLDRPLETVKTQLKRGLRILRDRLDESHGGDGVQWALALVPLAVPLAPLVPVGVEHGGGASSGTAKGIGLSAQGIVAVGAAVLVASVAGGLWLASAGGPAAEADQDTFITADPGLTAMDAEPDDVGQGAVEDVRAPGGTTLAKPLAGNADGRLAMGAGEPSAPAAVAAEAERPTFTLHVEDEFQGGPIAAAEVRWALVDAGWMAQAFPLPDVRGPEAGVVVTAPGSDLEALVSSSGSLSPVASADDGPGTPAGPVGDGIPGESVPRGSAGESEPTPGIQERSPDPIEEGEALTDADGNALLPAPREGEELMVYAMAKGYVAGQLFLCEDGDEGAGDSDSDVDPGAEGGATQRLKLQRSGTVTIRRGGANAELRMELRLVSVDGYFEFIEALPEGQNEIELDGIIPGEYWLLADSEPGPLAPGESPRAALRLEGRPVSISAGEELSLDLWITGGETLVVTVVGAGSLGSDFSVELSQGKGGATGVQRVPLVEGRATFREVSPGDHELTVWSGGVLVQRESLLLRAPAEDGGYRESVTLAPGGLMVSASDASEVEGITLALTGPIGAGTGTSPRRVARFGARAGEPLTALFPGLAAGRYELWTARGSAAHREEIEVVDGITATQLNAPGSASTGLMALELSVCGCVGPLESIVVESASGSIVPLDLTAVLCNCDLRPEDVDEEALAKIIAQQSEVPEATLELPAGDYRVTLVTIDGHTEVQPITVGMGVKEMTLHTDVAHQPIAIRIRVPAGETRPHALFAVPMDHAEGSMPLADLIPLDDEGMGETILRAGRYRVTAEGGWVAHFGVTEGQSQVDVLLERPPAMAPR